jgi:superfamily II DNA or RNA helicase
MQLRAHQRDALALAADPGFGRDFKKILAAVTPGGGKSSLPVIFGLRALAAGIADKICWAVPRDSLKKQAAEAFADPRWRDFLSHRLEIREADNEPDPTRGSNGYATTLQAIGAAPELHAREFKRHRYVLVLDEMHHVAEGSLWAEALGPLIENAVMVVFMSGTLSRDDDKPIAFIRYEDLPDGTSGVVLESEPDYRVVRYTRAQALAEEATLPIYFERLDGAARWIDTSGEEREAGSLRGAAKNTAGAIRTLLRSDYAAEVIESMLGHYRGYLSDNPRSKFLIVAPNIEMCRVYLRVVHDLGFERVDKATSDDGVGNRNIDRLKGKCRPHHELQGLVTVGMAYEGLDCPSITHIAALTQVRSVEWLEQMLARATRVDYAAGPYEGQAAHVWAPDDDLFSAAVKRIREEQNPFVEVREKKKRESSEKAETEAGEGFQALEGSSTSGRAQSLQSDATIDSDEFRRLKAAQVEAGTFQLSLFEIKQVVDAEPVRFGLSAEAKSTLTLKEQEKRARKTLHSMIGRKSGGNPQAMIEVNKKVLRRFGVPRPNMSIAQLKQAISFVETL